MKTTPARARATATPKAKLVEKKATAKAAAAVVSRATQKTKPATRKTAAKPKPAAASPRAGSTPGTSSPDKKPTASPLEKSTAAKPLQAKKKRAPKDLAAQYGEKEKAPRQSVVAKTPRKRRDAAARARLQEVIAPDDALLLRLARAGAISSSLAPASADEKPPGAVKTRRSRNWEAHCGKCGKIASYRASAALCQGCGAILVRE